MNLYQKNFNGIPFGFVCIHWIIWVPTTLLIVASYFNRIKLIYLAWLGVYLRGIIWLFQIENITERYSGNLEIYREKFTDTFYAGYFLYLCVQVFEKLAKKYCLYVWFFNIIIMAIGTQSRCYGLRNSIKISSENGIANGFSVLFILIMC